MTVPMPHAKPAKGVDAKHVVPSAQHLPSHTAHSMQPHAHTQSHATSVPAAPVSSHPEETQPLGAPHAEDPLEQRITFLLILGIIIGLILSPIIAVTSESPWLNVLIGLSPMYLTFLLGIAAIHHHFKPIALWVILISVHLVSLALLWLINLLLIVPINVANACAVSLFMAALWLGVVAIRTTEKGSASRSRAQHSSSGAPSGHVVPFKEEKLSEYVHSIEDKCKALNFVIGRVYRNSNGTTPKVRERLRIPSDWYNDFHGIKAEDMHAQKDKAKVLVRKIRDRLSLHAMKEKDVFSPQELASFKHLVRHKDGEDAVIDVLKTNDRDPVEHYYVSAVDFCDRILHELEK